MEEGSNGKVQLERYSSGSSYSGSRRHKIDRPPKYEKILHEQGSQPAQTRYEKKQLVNDAVDKIYDRAQYEVDQLPTERTTEDKFQEERTSVGPGSRYDRLGRASLSKSITDGAYRDPQRDKYERLDKSKEAKKPNGGNGIDKSNNSIAKPPKTPYSKSQKLSAGELALLQGVCRCSAMGGRPHLHRSVDDKVSV